MDPRTCLFVPGDRPDRFAKALTSGADAVVLDLEDAVAPAGKADACASVLRWCGQADAAHRASVVRRINDAQSSAFADDLRLLDETGLAQVMLPTAKSADDVQALRAAVPHARVLALIESARGVARAGAVAQADGVERLVFGTLDYALDLDLDTTTGAEGLSHAASVLAVASRVAGLPAAVAGVTPQLDDTARPLSDLAWARRHGFGAKLCIHPRQVAPVRTALAPTPEALDWARRVVPPNVRPQAPPSSTAA